MDYVISNLIDSVRLVGHVPDAEALEGIIDALAAEPLGSDEDFDSLAEAAAAARVRHQQRQTRARVGA